MISRSAMRAAVSARPCVSTKPTTTSIPRSRIACASSSIRYVLPTPAACPRYTFRFPRFGSREASFRNASGSGRSRVVLDGTCRLWGLERSSRRAGCRSRRGGRCGCDLRMTEPRVDPEVESENVDPALAIEAEKPPVGVPGEKRLEVGDGNPGLARDGRTLQARVLRRDVGIHARSGRRDGIGRDGSGDTLVASHGRHRVLDGVGELFRSGTEVRSSGGRRVVAVSRRGGPAVEMSGPHERLPDETRSDGHVVPRDEASIGLVSEGDASDGPDERGIAEPEEHRKRQEEPEGTEHVFFHRTPTYRRRATSRTSIALMPMKGTRIPPMP